MSFLSAWVALLAATPALAGGINLAWDDCGLAGRQTRAFACNTNEGTNTLVVSFQPFQDLPDVVGADIYLQMMSADPEVPPWWEMFNSGSCRGAGIPVTSIDFGTTCTDLWAGASTTAGGIGFYTISGRSATLLALWARLDPQPVSSTQEYYAIALQFDHRRTVGDGACAGCHSPMAIACNLVALAHGDGASQVTRIEYAKDRSWACWQCDCTPTTSRDLWFFSSCPTLTRTPTWGAIKSQYR